MVDFDIKRPALRWHGGKWLLAPWIVGQMPAHRIYVEPYGGAASVLLRKPRSYAEVYNDLDDEVVNLFRVLQDPPRAARLVALLRLTPFARREFELAYEISEDPIEEARRLIVRSFMGFGSDGHNRAVKTGFRADAHKSGTTPARDWSNYPDCLKAITDRFQGVVVENRDALEVMRQHDRPTTLFYVDPPYMPEVRSQKSRRDKLRYHAYRHEMTWEEHDAMCRYLASLDGMVILSGYRSPLYDEVLVGWERLDKDTYADGARPRTESVWLNRACATALGHGPLFEGAA